MYQTLGFGIKGLPLGQVVQVGCRVPLHAAVISLRRGQHGSGKALEGAVKSIWGHHAVANCAGHDAVGRPKWQ